MTTHSYKVRYGPSTIRDMSNPLRPPKEYVTSAKAAFPDAYFEPGALFSERALTGRRVEVLQAKLAGLDMELRPTFYVPKTLCADAQVLGKLGPALATAKGGKMSLRVRTGPAHALTNVIWSAMSTTGSFASRDACEAKIRDTFFVDGGTEHTLGRLQKAYPRVGSTVAKPVTQSEATAALEGSGVDLSHLPDHACRAFPLVAAEGEDGVTVNPKSDNGFPVLAQWATPGASEKCLGLAVTVRKEIVSAARTTTGVREWKERAEHERPYLVACRGKAKADYYSAEKVEAGMMRFYNAMPRQIMLNMQVATQPLEKLSRSILEGSRTAIGISLVHGGAEELVQVLEQRLVRDGRAFVHVGDDSWVVVKTPQNVVWFALDCSNFDLTQHRDATLEVHKALWRQLRRFDAAAADLWYEYARGRLVVTAGALVRYWRHAGPSGMPLQSKVNDMLMDVLISRALDRGCEWWHEEAVRRLLQDVGEELGFAVKLEQYYCARASTLKEVLEERPFLFIGYNFFLRGGVTQVCTDVARTLAQMPYPSLKWLKTDREMEMMEAMRLGSIVLSAGLPPPAFAGAFQVWRHHAQRQLQTVMEKFGDASDDQLRWAVGEVAVGPQIEASLSGLLRALQRDPRQLWLDRPAELPATSLLVPLDWAGLVEEEEAEEVRAKRAVVPPKGGRLPHAVRALPAPLATHPPSEANDGRPPPTAVWGPPRPKRERQLRLRKGRVLPEEEEGWFSDREVSSEGSYDSS